MNKKSKLCFTSLALLFSFYAVINAQTIADFESFNLSDEDYLNGSNGMEGFTDGHVFLPNQYNANYDFWQGWAISNVTDNQTPGFLNQYSAITGSGFEESNNYAVSYAFDPVRINLTDEAIGGIVNGLQVTNATFAYLGIRDGDGFTKKFGGVTGDDPDYFKLTFKGFLDGALKQDSIDFYLADFRFDDNVFDYIIDEWTYVDLSGLGNVDSLQLSLSSTDTGAFGMNTPAYFCVDHIETKDVTSSVLDQSLGFEFESRITESNIQLDFTQPVTCHIFNVNGMIVYSGKTTLKYHDIDISELYPGVYNLMVYDDTGRKQSVRFYKK